MCGLRRPRRGRPKCKTLELYHEYLVVALQIVIGVMLIIRTYALYERNRSILLFMIAFSAGVIGVGVWGTLHSNALHPADKGSAMSLNVGCAYGITQPESIGLIISWSAMGLFDVMIFALTLFRTFTAMTRARLNGMHLMSVLMRDGCLYFGAMVLCNAGNIMTLVFGGGFTRGNLSTFTNIVSSIMISRLMLNLRDPAVSIRGSRTGTRSRTGTGTSVSWGYGVFSSYLDHDSDANEYRPQAGEMTLNPP
ncbi:hypothetical protein C8F01DRAFT_555101 [Mycena amicta]|nr:hypothetical protein C8F01DRAFT_555101 [Mycena amicta]